MRTVEELEALLETVTRERDVETNSALMFECDWKDACRERDEARADANMLEDRLSESRAEVNRLTDERDELLVRVEDQGAELRATREAYRDAYRRGAEAMRDECIGAACGFFMGTQGFCNGDEDELEAVLEALPIPEEP